MLIMMMTERESLFAEGSVLVEHINKSGSSALLEPGYGAEIEQNKNNILVYKVNPNRCCPENAMFIFDDESLGSIMKNCPDGIMWMSNMKTE